MTKVEAIKEHIKIMEAQDAAELRRLCEHKDHWIEQCVEVLFENQTLLNRSENLQAENEALRMAINKFVSEELTVGQRYTNAGQGLLDAI